MIQKTALPTTSAGSKRQTAQLVEDIAVESIIALFPVVVIVSILLVGALCGWILGAVVGAGLWALIGAIIAVCASFISNRADEGFLMTKRKAETKRQKMSRIWGEARSIYHKRTVRPDKARNGIIWYETSIDGRFSQRKKAS